MPIDGLIGFADSGGSPGIRRGQGQSGCTRQGDQAAGQVLRLPGMRRLQRPFSLKRTRFSADQELSISSNAVGWQSPWTPACSRPGSRPRHPPVKRQKHGKKHKVSAVNSARYLPFLLRVMPGDALVREIRLAMEAISVPRPA